MMRALPCPDENLADLTLPLPLPRPRFSGKPGFERTSDQKERPLYPLEFRADDITYWPHLPDANECEVPLDKGLGWWAARLRDGTLVLPQEAVKVPGAKSATSKRPR